MTPDRENDPIQEKIRALLAGPMEHRLSDAKRREFIARLYRVSEERRSVIERIRSIKVPVPALARATVAAFVVVMAVNYYFMPSFPVVSNVKGAVKIYRAGSNEWVFAEGGGMKLYRKDIVKTFGDGEADIAIPGVYHIRVKRESEMRLVQAPSRASGGDILYELSKGRAFTHYNKNRPKGGELRIDTSEAETSCLGTDFMMEVSPMMNKTWVGVLDGLVKVEGKGLEIKPGEMANAVLVRPGEKTVIFKDMAPARPTRLLENELLELEELYQIGTRPQVALLISTGPTRTRELLSVTPLYISAEKGGILPDTIRKAASQFNKAIKEHSEEMHLESIREFEELVNDHPNPKYDVQLLLFIGAYYEYLDEHLMAIETFDRVLMRYPRSGLASIAQCAIGIIYEEKLNDMAAAKEAYEKVISRYPRSAEVEEATAGLGRLSK